MELQNVIGAPNMFLRGWGNYFDARLYRVTPRGQRVLAAALAVHDTAFPAAYRAA